MVLFRENVFSALVLRFFLAKNQKTFKVGKVRKYDEVFFREENVFIFLNGKAQIIPVVAGRLV